MQEPQSPRSNPRPGSPGNPGDKPPKKDAPGEKPSGVGNGSARKSQPPQPVNALKGVKETIESILIAFILAFVFRAFVVEAFVIPTGSMAPTLLGAHMRFTCRECGYRWDVNYPAPSSRSNDDIDIPPFAGPVDSQFRYNPQGSTNRVVAVYCPNCKYKVSREDATNTPVHYGDRILVLKYLYIPWISHPSRWDVVVFKNPTDTTSKPDFSVNYIKRLVGLPGEEIMVLDGDIYARTGGGSAGTGRNDQGWQVQTKPRSAQDALWRVIYDNDFRPLEHAHRNEPWRFPWVHGENDGWDSGDADKARSFNFKNTAGKGSLTFDSTADSRYLIDWLAYNATNVQQRHGADTFDERSHAMVQQYPISDLKLSFSYLRQSGDGPLRARLSKYDHQFIAELTPEQVRLIHRLPDGQEVEVGQPKALPRTSAPRRVDLINVDYQVTLRIDDQIVFQTTREQYHPDLQELLNRYYARRDVRVPPPTIAIEAARQEAQLSHVSLWRDVYYTPEDVQSRAALPQASPERPISLGAQEFFVLGDNSAASYDGRFWSNTISLPEESLEVGAGRVPGRFLLGKAFFVYWPSGYRPLSNAPAVVPNFGSMRLIH